ncbi:LacI family DNA-binding transcriptional regulator [Thalassococcus sp. BH17M4-6]|uniref:LacI family DNA-binding transcriptional regulator n=1 Tax=Thalassococcus sp. BH17M4-6 TaxID=3413148 RepID=UPI003BC253FD
MARRATIKDVARASGLSTATIDRALNGRANVREETLRNIAEAARDVGYHARGLLDYRIDANVPELRLGVLLLKERQPFFQAFRDKIERAVASRSDIRGRVTIRFAQSQSPAEFAELIGGLGEESQAVAAMAVNHQSLDKVVSELRSRDVPVFSLLNDFAQGIRRSYIGLNNLKVGRQAAWMLTRIAPPGRFAIFVGGNRWHGHDLREVGFRAFMREHGSGFETLETLVNLETRQVTYEATLSLLERYPDLRGIYVAGGGMEGAIAALRQVRPPGKVSLVVNEITPDSRAALLDGYVQMAIVTPLDELCQRMIDLAIRAASDPMSTSVEQHFLEPRIILPEIL